MTLFYLIFFVFFNQCPFHGKIIGRDNMGRPTNKEDAERLAKDEAAKNGEPLIYCIKETTYCDHFETRVISITTS